MGNRAFIVFEANSNEKPKGSEALPAVYLHWNGGPESIYAILAYTKELCRAGDRDYIPARFVQIVGNYFASNLSLGLSATKREDIRELADVGDNGVYVVNTDTWEVTQRHLNSYEDCKPSTPGCTQLKNLDGSIEAWKKVFKSLTKKQIEKEKAEALAHCYHTGVDDKGRKVTPLIEQLREVNDPFFKKDYRDEVKVTLVKHEEPKPETNLRVVK